MPNILELMTAPKVVDFVNGLETRPYLGDTLFPNEKIAELEIEYIVGAEGLPVAANLHAWDTEAQLGSRQGWETRFAELALIKRKMVIREKELIKLNAPRNSAEEQRILMNIFNDVKTVVDSVRVKTEVMKMEALVKGKLNLNENGVVGTIDFGRDASQNVVLAGSGALDSIWSSPTADILGQLETWMNMMAAKGKTLTRAVTSRAVLALMTKNKAIKSAINGINESLLVSVDQMNNLFRQYGFPTFIAYDEMYNVEKGDGSRVATRFLDGNYVILMPSEPIGKGYFGPTAEEIELSRDPSFNLNRVGNILAMVYRQDEPLSHWTKAVTTFMPTAPLINDTVAIKVL